MSSYPHRPHPQGFDPTDALLFDNCEACLQHAYGNGLTLDETSLARAWNRMLNVERGTETYRTENEAILCRRLHEFALLMDRHPVLRLNPWLRMDAEDE